MKLLVWYCLMKDKWQYQFALKAFTRKDFSAFLCKEIGCWCGNVEFPEYEYMIIVMRVLDNNHGTC